jgi:hypothetical protein
MGEPTYHEVRAAIGEFMGWRSVDMEGTERWLPPVDQQDRWRRGSGEAIGGVVIWPWYLPDYANDLKAMYEVEAGLFERQLHTAYLDELEVAVQHPDSVGPGLWECGRGVAELVHATAQQRALAAYMVIKALEVV